MVATIVTTTASIHRIPRCSSSKITTTSSAIRHTAHNNGIPVNRCTPIAPPSTSAKSHAAIAISQSTHRKIVTGQDGGITIPAVACSNPTTSTGKIRFMKSYPGGLQMHCNRLGNAEPFEYSFDVPAAGQYALSARVVTVSPDQHLLVAANDAREPVDIAAPYTIGKWEQTQPVEITLVKGKNVLRFTRNEPVRGMSIKEFKLMPVK